MDNIKNIRWGVVLAFVYLNSAFLSFFLLLFSSIEVTLKDGSIGYSFLLFLLVPPAFGFFLDYVNSNKRIALLRYYIKAIKVSFLMLVVFFLLYFLFPDLHSVELSLVALVFLFLLINLFYVPVNSFLDFLAPHKQLPYVLAIITSSTYSVFLYREELSMVLFPRLGLWLFFLLGLMTVHGGFLFRKQIRKEKIIFSKSKLETTAWNKIVWMAILLGLGHVSLMYIYPKFFLMYNEPHGVSKFDADMFGQIMFFGTIVLILPFGMLVSKYGVQKFIKTNNTILVLSVLSAIFFPEYFLYEAVVSMVSLSLAIVTNLPVAYYHLATRHRAFGTGVFFGIVLTIVFVSRCLLK